MDGIEAQVVRETGKPLPPPPNLPIEVVQKMPFKELVDACLSKPDHPSYCLSDPSDDRLLRFCKLGPHLPSSLRQRSGAVAQLRLHLRTYESCRPYYRNADYRTHRTQARSCHAFLYLWQLRVWSCAFTKSAVAVIIIGALLTVFGSWFASIFHAYQAELFPTRARATGVGFTYGWSRVSAVFST